MLHLSGGFAAAFKSLLPSFHPQDLLVGAIGAALIALALQMKKANAKKYRKGIEYGSARWGTAADIAPYIAPDFDKNVILTQTERIMMDNRPKNPAHAVIKTCVLSVGAGAARQGFS